MNIYSYSVFAAILAYFLVVLATKQELNSFDPNAFYVSAAVLVSGLLYTHFIHNKNGIESAVEEVVQPPGTFDKFT